jgi:proline iminopeptidase
MHAKMRNRIRGKHLKKGFWDELCGKRHFYPACDYPPTEKKSVTANGIRFWVETEGRKTGVPLIIVHGGPGFDHRGFHPRMSVLAKHRRLVYYDQRGCYMSSEPRKKTEHGLVHDVKDLECIRKALGFNKIDVLGYSYGGWVAMTYALEYGYSLQRLVVCSTPIGETDDELERRIEKHPLMVKSRLVRSPKAIEEAYWKWHFVKTVPPDVLRYNQMARVAYGTNKSRRLANGHDAEPVVGRLLGLLDYSKVIEQIAKPVLVLAGRRDPGIVPKLIRQVVSKARNAKLVLFEHSSHDPFVDETARFEKVVERFLSAKR